MKKTLVTVVVALLALAASAEAALITDEVPEMTANPATGRTDLAIGVTLENIRSNLAGDGAVDTSDSPWEGNGYTYSISDTSGTAGDDVAAVTYTAASEQYFDDFEARVIVNNGQFGQDGDETDVMPAFTFAGASDGGGFTAIAVSQEFVSGGDWVRFSITPDSPVDIDQLRIGVRMPEGDWWHQQIGSVTVSQIPEPATMSLLTIGGLGAVIRRRRK